MTLKFIGALEGAYKLAYGELLSFSEQNLIDCDNWKHGGRNHGCNGGDMDRAFNWVQKNSGLCLEDDYKYISGDTKLSGKCEQSTCQKIVSAAPKSIVDVEINSDYALMYALSKQPVSVAIEADQQDFQLYQSGIFTAHCGANLDHG